MKLWAIAILCAFVFLVCFLVVLLLRKLFPKEKIEKSKQVVHLPRRQAIFGIILTFASTTDRFSSTTTTRPSSTGISATKKRSIIIPRFAASVHF